MKGIFPGLGSAAEIAAMVMRLKRRGLVGLKPPLTPDEVDQEFNRIRNKERKPTSKEQKATKGAKG